MTSLPVPASRPWFSSLARLVSVPGLSLPYQLRISRTRSVTDPPEHAYCVLRLWPPPFSRRAAYRKKLVVEPHIVCAADDERCALVYRPRLHVENPFGARRREPTGLLDDERKRRALVQEAELALGVIRVGRVEVDTALEEVAVDVCYERSGVPERIRPMARRGSLSQL